MSKVKTSEIPHRAKYLYIKLYCQRKGGKTEENLSAASQSWLSLSAAKKQHFRDTISTKQAIVTAQRIIKTKPYLKKLNPSKRRKQSPDHKHENEVKSHSYNRTNLETTENGDRIEYTNFSISFADDNSVALSDKTPTETFGIDTENTKQANCELEPTLSENTTQIEKDTNEPNIQEDDTIPIEKENNEPNFQDDDTTQIEKDTNEPNIQDDTTQIEKDTNEPNIQDDDTTQIEKDTNEPNIQDDDTTQIEIETNEANIQEDDTTQIDKDTNEPNIQDDDTTQIDKETNEPNFQDDTNFSKESRQTKYAEYTPVPEPLLPVVKKGRDLYELLRVTNGQSQKSYESLTVREKKSYGDAVRAIRRDYVKKYKLYLESLPSRQLFNHYLKVLDTTKFIV